MRPCIRFTVSSEDLDGTGEFTARPLGVANREYHAARSIDIHVQTVTELEIVDVHRRILKCSFERPVSGLEIDAPDMDETA